MLSLVFVFTPGIAGIGSMCTTKSTGVSRDYSSPDACANTFAHEMGHSIGLLHHESSCSCENPPCVMSKTASSSQAQVRSLMYLTRSIAGYRTKKSLKRNPGLTACQVICD